ncbi:ABC transporter substrate-binding protein [Bacillus sp. M6-12]|uniref:ABC transporter substrate-binding protein n=1 Tax=Bacillus sp. M6-12 TaxID=2054166 RepID=UPI000C78BE3C|nr:ABC transporter substrate-binding protein [Bacillus sp. M6-12]PLS16138.1 ABC transporter substrate-binding protein [Bacillus sp. M6-12]
MRKKLGLAILLTLMLILSACTGGSKESSSSSSTKSKDGEKQLIVASDQDPVGLDPHKTPAASSVRVYSLIYDRLVHMDSEMKIVPALAEKWNISEDGKSITFNLVKGVKFHNGREMTSEDVKFSFERILNPDTGSTVKSYFSSIAKIETPDAQTVVFHLSAPDAAFLNNASVASAAIVPKEVKDLNTEAVGTGPFILDKMEAGQFVTLKKNPDYYNKDRVKVDSIKFNIMKDESQRTAALRSGKVDVASISADTASLLEKAKNVEVKGYQSMEYSYLGINTAKKPFNDVKVRQAISFAIDRQAIVDTVWKGKAALTGPISPAAEQWATDAGKLPGYKQDTNKAKSLLAEAGYPDGFDTTIYTASTYPDMIDSAQVIQEQLKAIGVNAQIKQLEWGAYIEMWKSKNTDLLVGRNTSGTDPDRSTRYFFSTEGSANVWNYSNKEFDSIVQKALETNDENQRKTYYDQAQTILAEENPNLFLASPMNFYAVSGRVQGFEPTVAGESVALLNASLK